MQFRLSVEAACRRVQSLSGIGRQLGSAASESRRHARVTNQGRLFSPQLRSVGASRHSNCPVSADGDAFCFFHLFFHQTAARQVAPRTVPIAPSSHSQCCCAKVCARRSSGWRPALIGTTVEPTRWEWSVEQARREESQQRQASSRPRLQQKDAGDANESDGPSAHRALPDGGQFAVAGRLQDASERATAAAIVVRGILRCSLQRRIRARGEHSSRTPRNVGR